MTIMSNNYCHIILYYDQFNCELQWGLLIKLNEATKTTYSYVKNSSIYF